MLNIFRKKEKSLKDHLRQTKKIKINGVIFHIKKMNIEDHVSGLDVIFKFYAVYKTKPEKDLEKFNNDVKKLKKAMKDIIYAGVVKPKLTMKQNDGDLIHVDEILQDLILTKALTEEIIAHTFGKKK